MKKVAMIIGIIGIFLLIQPANAQTWGASKRLTWTAGASYYPAIAIDSNNHIHMVWMDEMPGNWEIYYKKSTDGGINWTTKRLTWNTGPSRFPAIIADSNNYLHVVWEDNSTGIFTIFYKKSTDGGESWTTKRLTWSSFASYNPTLAVDSVNHLHVVLYNWAHGNAEIYYKKSKDGGASWTTQRLTWNSENSLNPVIAADSSNYLHVVWYDSTPGNYEIYYKKSTDGGTSWTTNRLTTNSGGSWLPVIAIDSNDHIHLAWYDGTHGNQEIYYNKSTDGGMSWESKRLTWNLGDSSVPDIAVDTSNHIHVVWYDWTPSDPQIYYKRSTNGGTTWTTKRLTWNSGQSVEPAIAVDSANSIHVVWEDLSPGNAEIFYKKGIQ